MLARNSLLADLARSEFSDFEILNTWPIPQSLNAIANGERARRPVLSERQKVFDAWRARHEALPDEQIKALLEKARAAEVLRTEEREAIKRAANEAVERHRTDIDWRLWSSLPTVKIWEAAALYAGLNPEAWAFESISAAGPLGRTGDFARAFSRLMRASGPQGPVQTAGDAHPSSSVSTRQAATFMVKTCNGQPPAEFAELATAPVNPTGVLPPGPQPEDTAEPSLHTQEDASRPTPVDSVRKVITQNGRPRVAWRLALEELLPGFEASLGRQANVNEVIRHLKSHGASYGIQSGGNVGELNWHTVGENSPKKASSKTISNALAALRGRSGNPR